MSRRKHLLQSMEQEVEPPAEGQHIVRATAIRGSNHIEVEFPDGRTTLCLLPAKFKKKLWVRKGSFLIVEDAPQAEEEGSAVTGTIAAVLYADHVKQLRRMPGVWPPEFDSSSSSAAAGSAQVADQLAALGVSDSDGEEGDAAAPPAAGAAAGTAAAVAAAAAQQEGSRAAAAGSAAAGDEGSGGGYSSSDDDLPPIPKFNNRKVITYEVSDSDDSDEE